MAKRSAQHPEIATLVVHLTDAGGAVLHHVARKTLLGEVFAVATGAELGRYLDAGHAGVVGGEGEDQRLLTRHLAALAWARAAAYRPFTEWYTTAPGHPAGSSCPGFDFILVEDADRFNNSH